MIGKETCAQIRRYFYAEHWKIGTIVRQLGVHPDTVRNAIEAERFHGTQPLRASIVDPYVPFLRQTLEQYPDLRATRLYLMIRDRGYLSFDDKAADLLYEVVNRRYERKSEIHTTH